MTDQDKKPFALIMGELSAAFSKDSTRETMAVYFKHLADYQLVAVEHAANQAIKTGERFPVIKTLRELANAYRPPQKRQPMTDSVQLTEFSETQVADAKQNLADLVNGLESGMSCV